jgi:hypothetical protein
MGGSSHSLGLCSNCARAPQCVYPRPPGRPVVECDEYECAPRGTGRLLASGRGAAPLPTAPVAEASETSGNCAGLCTNCANLAHCTFPRPEGGIWHCEEYR